jgi:hypothetical protein
MGRLKKSLPLNTRQICVNGNDILIRSCPVCDADIQYKGKSRIWNIQVAIKNNTVCNKCNTSKFNSTKKPWNVGIPMSDIAKNKNSLIKRGKPIHSAEYKLWLGTHGTFTRKDENSVVVQSYLNKHKITYEMYISLMSAFKVYKRKCIQITNQQDIHKLLNYEKRGVSGKYGAYQLDHIISIKEGFDQNLDPNLIGNISNLHFIPWEDNIKKSIIYKNKGINGYIK